MTIAEAHRRLDKLAARRKAKTEQPPLQVVQRLPGGAYLHHGKHLTGQELAARLTRRGGGEVLIVSAQEMPASVQQRPTLADLRRENEARQAAPPLAEGEALAFLADPDGLREHPERLAAAAALLEADPALRSHLPALVDAAEGLARAGRSGEVDLRVLLPLTLQAGAEAEGDPSFEGAAGGGGTEPSSGRQPEAVPPLALRLLALFEEVPALLADRPLERFPYCLNETASPATGALEALGAWPEAFRRVLRLLEQHPELFGPQTRNLACRTGVLRCVLEVLGERPEAFPEIHRALCADPIARRRVADEMPAFRALIPQAALVILVDAARGR